MMVYVVIEPGAHDESDVVLAVYRTRAAAEAHQQAGDYLRIEEHPLLDAYEAAR
jgi:hypothetical protein